MSKNHSNHVMLPHCEENGFCTGIILLRVAFCLCNLCAMSSCFLKHHETLFLCKTVPVWSSKVHTTIFISLMWLSQGLRRQAQTHNDKSFARAIGNSSTHPSASKSTVAGTSWLLILPLVWPLALRTQCANTGPNFFHSCFSARCPQASQATITQVLVTQNSNFVFVCCTTEGKETQHGNQKPTKQLGKATTDFPGQESGRLTNSAAPATHPITFSPLDAVTVWSRSQF